MFTVEFNPSIDLDEPPAPRAWCDECQCRTLFTRDMDGMPLCREHAESVRHFRFVGDAR